MIVSSLNFLKSNKTIFLFFSIIFLGILISLTLKNFRTIPDSEEIKETILKVKTKNILLENLKIEERAFGEVRGKKQAIIRAPLGGVIKEFSDNLDDGKFVKKGTYLYQIDPFNFNQKVIENEALILGLQADISAAKASYIEAKLQRQIAEKNYIRRKSLLGNTVTQKALDDANDRLSIAKSKEINGNQKISSNKAKLDQAKVILALSKRQLSDTTLLAPFDGVLSNTQVDEGSEVVRGDKIAKITNTEDLEVKFFIGESVFAKLSENNNLIGNKIKIIWRVGASNREYDGIIVRVDGVIDDKAAGLNIYAKLNGVKDSDPIRPGVFVEIIVQGALVTKSVILPEKSIYNGNTIYILSDNKLEAKQIMIMGKIGRNMIVKGKINNGDKVLLTRLTDINKIKKVYSIDDY